MAGTCGQVLTHLRLAGLAYCEPGHCPTHLLVPVSAKVPLEIGHIFTHFNENKSPYVPSGHVSTQRCVVLSANTMGLTLGHSS